MSTKILVADDDKDIINLVDLYLKNEGYIIFKAYDGEQALDIIAKEAIDLLILDIMMPKLDGLDVCKHVRMKGNTPILMLSAKAEDMDKILGLTIGADDYMEKPFNPLELIARVKALLRRTSMQIEQFQTNTNELHIHSLIIDKEKHIVQANGQLLNLTPLEFNILYLLASHPDRVYSSEEIFEHVWQEVGYGVNKTVMVHISNLRDKIDSATNGDKVIQTVWGVGYKIES